MSEKDWIAWLKGAQPPSDRNFRKELADAHAAVQSNFFYCLQDDDDLRNDNLGDLASPSETIHRMRSLLGPWYGTMVLGDLLSYEKGSSDPERRLAQRMKCLLRETLAWIPEAVTAEVVLHSKEGKPTGNEPPFRDCIAANSDLKLVAEIAQQHSIKYAEKYGSTVALNIHALSETRFTRADGRSGLVGKRAVEAVRRRHLCYVGPVANLLPNPMERPSGEQTYIEQLNQQLQAKGVGQIDTILHLASGLSVFFDQQDHTATAHIWITCNFGANDPVLDITHERAIRGLLGRISGFSALQSLEAESKHNQRYRLMVEMLEPPLRTLTRALESTVRETQELRSILYEPSVALFAAREAIGELFDEGRQIENPDGSVSTAAHNLSPARLPDCDASWLLAHALARLHGREIERISRQSINPAHSAALSHESKVLEAAFSDSTSPHHGLAKGIVRLLGSPTFSDIKQERNARIYLSKIKDGIYSPFKPNNARRAIPFDLFCSLLPSGWSIPRQTVIDVAGNSVVQEQNNKCILLADRNPMSTQAHLLGFLLGLLGPIERTGIQPDMTIEWRLSQSLIQSNDCSTASSVTLSIKKKDSEDWIKSPDLLMKRLENVKTVVINEGVRWSKADGDLHRPFVELYQRAPIDSLTGFVFCANCDSSVLQLSDKLSFFFAGETMTMTCRS